MRFSQLLCSVHPSVEVLFSCTHILQDNVKGADAVRGHKEDGARVLLPLGDARVVDVPDLALGQELERQVGADDRGRHGGVDLRCQ